MNAYRYPGVKPFEASESNRFFGRENDLSDLFRLIALEKLVVLFGKSGYGKSSLLNAGIIPRFEAETMEQEDESGNVQTVKYQPVVVRFGNYIPGQTPELLERVREKFLAHFPDPVANGPLWKTFSDDPQLPLWYLFKKHGAGHVVLIFDQFEEFFSYPPEQQYRFRIQLSELLYTRIPQKVRDTWATLNRDEKNFLSRPMDVKTVFAIRSDRMSELDKLSGEMSAILHKRYELQALSIGQAREAVVKPAALPQSDGFVSPAFSYQPAALQRMLDGLSDNSATTPGAPGAGGQGAARIEAFQLQVLCQHVEQAVIRGEIKDQVAASDLPDIAHIFETYYHGQLSQLTPAEQPAAQAIIENGLLYDDPATGEARRLSVDADQLVQQFRGQGATHELLRRLENTFLLRRETSNLGRFNYEISHDTLVAPILKNKRAHDTERKQREAERKTREAEEKMRAEQARAAELEKLRWVAEENAQQAHASRSRAEANARRANIVAVMAVGLALAALNFWYSARQAQREARRNEQMAVANAGRADSLLVIAQKERTAALLSDSSARHSAMRAEAALQRQLEAEQQARQEQIQKYLTEARNFHSRKRFQDAVKAYRNAAELDDRQTLKTQIAAAIAQCRADENRNDFERNRDIGLSMKAANDCTGALRYLRKALTIEPEDESIKKAIRACEDRR